MVAITDMWSSRATSVISKELYITSC
jgi:hypothetical protein